MKNLSIFFLLAPLVLSQTSCGVAAYQMQRLMQIPTSVLRADNTPAEETAQPEASSLTEDASLPPA